MAYERAKKRKAHYIQKSKKNTEIQQSQVNSDQAQFGHLNSSNQIKPTFIDIAYGTEQVSATADPMTPNTPFGVNKGTLANIRYGIRKFVTKSPRKTLSHCVTFINSQSEAYRNKAIEYIKDVPKKIQNEKETAEKFSDMIKALKHSTGEKSEITYTVLTHMSSFFRGYSISQIQKYLGVNFVNAKKIKNGEKLGRKVYTRIISDEVVYKVVKYYESDAVSRIDMNKSTASKKWGPKRYMYTTIKLAYLNFITNNPEMKISFSTFHKLRPRNVKIRKDTPLISSLCPHCHNIRLKLRKANVPGVKTEYELYHYLICEKDHTKMGKAACVMQKCEKCCDWKAAIDKLLSNVPDQDKCITWYSWRQSEYTLQNGGKGVHRKLVCQTKPFEIFKQELMDDIMKPLQRCTFVEHHFTHRFQHKIYDECISSLKPGQCVMVQDFAKNRDIIFQDEIKSNYWSNLQVTMHPSVLYYRLNECEKIKKIGCNSSQ